MARSLLNDRVWRRTVLVLSCWIGLAGALVAAPPQKVDFARDVFPILEAKCFHCHGPDEHEGHLRLDSKVLVFKGGISGKLFEKGKGQESLLYKRLAGVGEEDQMPLDDEPLSKREMALVASWIDQGAPWPDGLGSKATKLNKHWAYEKPVRPELPKVKDADWPQNAIDHFTRAKMREHGFSPSPQADRARLIRRVSLDLIGLPPTVEQVDRFVNDTSPDAYEKLVDRLLASKHYGERWAQIWLDAARYADSNGYQADQIRTVWPYRDWVIQALNDDMPFDQFTIEQIAGDLLPGATLDQKIASGFHRLTTCNVEAGVDPEENRVEQIIDRVNTTGTVWLGTSIECGQCHNHKYDPFTQKDYYQLFAYFNNTPLEVARPGNKGVQYNFVGPKMDLPLEPEKKARRNELQARHNELQSRLKKLMKGIDQKQAEWEQEMLTAVKNSAEWHVLDVAKFESAGGATCETLDDKSLVIGGDNPDKDTYTLTVHTELKDISAFKVEALLHDSLPGNGPGRQTQRERGNFVLNEWRVTTKAKGKEGPGEAVRWARAEADYANPKFPVTDAIDGDSETGWSIHTEYHKPHHAIFYPENRIGGKPGTTVQFQLEQVFGAQRTIGRLRISALTGDPEKPDMPEAITKILMKDAKKRSDKEAKKLAEFFQNQDPKIKRTKAEMAAVKADLDSIKPLTTLVMVEMDKPRDTHILKRGDFLNPGEKVEPGTPRILNQLPEDAPPNRLGLARWLVDRENPLTARVAVNRWWAEFFGQGIVATIEDFGTQGEPPTHPQLLDWLAVELMENGWSMKHVHKKIVTSATYRQSSKITRERLKRDPYNLWLARGPRHRLPAEIVRDNALAASGLLSTKMGGPPVFPPQPPKIWRHVGRNAPVYKVDKDEDRFRRGIYIIWRRSAPYPSMVNFDAPDRSACTVKRPKTNTPLQALTLMNDPAYVEMSLALAERMQSDHPELSVEEKVVYGFRRVLARRPKPEEQSHLVQVYQRELKRIEADPKLADQIVGTFKISPDTDKTKLAAWFYVANILLNLDETITKG